ncbi:MAG: dihydroneopterin aldolase [Paracoccaceae bacterium]|nr:MAG: dihydroneopterin aldolase [Paracoccaceae bacterium]
MTVEPAADPVASAFAHPEARARALRGPMPRDRILLREHIVTADIGAFQPERGRTQRLRFDVAVEVAPVQSPLADDVDRILSYDRITDAIAAELAAERLNLLETLAERVATRVLAEPQAERVFLRVEKLDLGPHAKGVEIVRSRAALPETAPQDAPPRPLVVHLDAAAVAAPDLPDRLSRWQADGAPLVMTVGFPDLPRPRTGHAPTERRIDLLAIEQQAWVLAARDRRCVVVATRTEIDWALRQGRCVVWAPGKMVLDAVDGPRFSDPLVLALWLAETFHARAVLVHGDVTFPGPAGIPVMRA